MNDETHHSMNIPCCPELLKTDNCDVLFFTRTLNYPIFAKERDVRLVAQLILGFRFKRCTLGLTLGDPVYSTTLLPGEKVKLVTTDRRTSFSYDASTQMSYRSEQMSEEQYFMKASQTYFSDLETEQSGNAKTTDKGRWDFHGDAEGGLKSPWSAGGDANASGSHDSSSTLEYLHRQSANMHSAATQAVNATHMAHSISIGEVATRTHIEGKSEEHFEASSREFSNQNSCHAVTYIFYRLNKKVVITFELVSVDKAVSLPGAASNPGAFVPTIPPDLRAEALKLLDKELIAAGLIDKSGQPSAELKKRFDFKIESALPTAGIIVKGCLDQCNTCEPARRERVHLENEMLRKQIDLLDKSQEYRCCPGECKEEPAPVGP